MCSNQKISCVRIKRFLVPESKDFLCSNHKSSCVRIKKFLVFESRDVLCSNHDISCVPIKTCLRSQGGHVVVPTEDMCWRTVRDRMGWNFGRTDLRISASKAKFDARAAPSFWPCVVRNLAKFPDPSVWPDPRISRFFFFAPNFVLQFLRPPNFFVGDFHKFPSHVVTTFCKDFLIELISHSRRRRRRPYVGLRALRAFGPFGPTGTGPVGEID